jgi:hypothetical protein
MQRGKQQVLFNYLPGRTFDYERVATIARVESIRGIPHTNLNASILLRKIAEAARAWQMEFRPGLRDEVFRDANRFILLDPQGVEAEMFPKVFWCQNRMCGLVFDYSNNDSLPLSSCPRCNQGDLIQLRFIKIHRCGAIQPLRPPSCNKCHNSNNMALDTRESERISNFRWVCRRCNTSASLFGGRCPECQWPGQDTTFRNMDIEVHRAGRTFYAHTAVLLNVPDRHLDAFFNVPDWPAIVAAKLLRFPEVEHRSLADFSATATSSAVQDTGLSGVDLDDLMRRQTRGEITPAQFIAEMQALRQQRQGERGSASPSGMMQAIEQRSGVDRQIWEQAGHELLEAIIPFEISRPRDLTSENNQNQAIQTAHRLGLSGLSLIADFPIITATYGYSRAEYAPNQCRLNPFPAERAHGGRFPIFVDQIQADALFLSLNPGRVCNWLESNGFPPDLPNGDDPELSRRAYFVRLFDGVQLRETLRSDRPQVRMTFGLLHTLSHLFVRQSALLCGLDTTSLSEYVLPKALSFAIYCNHRFGATIGALTALFEQSANEWLNAVRETTHCVYDPVCYDRDSSCHACTHLPETSCRFYNLNLSRALLFGGPEPELGHIRVGYFDPSLLRD